MSSFFLIFVCFTIFFHHSVQNGNLFESDLNSFRPEFIAVTGLVVPSVAV